MAKIQIGDIDHYNSTSTNFFKLENDRDTAKVRFMYNDINDVQLDVVHEVDVGGKKRYVNCLRTYDEPVDNCPMCKAGMRPQIKLFVPVYNINAGEVQFWQRGKSFIGQISSFCDRYKPLVGTVIEIERNGKKGEQTTKYNFYPDAADGVTMDQLPDVPDTLSGFILSKTYEEMADYVENGYFSGDAAPAVRTPEIQRRPTAPVEGRTRPKF